MSSSRLKLSEGVWFAVPLRSEGYAVGHLARYKAPLAFGYFFGPVLPDVPQSIEFDAYPPEAAVARAMFGDLGLLSGDWPLLGYQTADRSIWPLPPFVRVDQRAGKAWMTVYDETTLMAETEHRCKPELADRYPRDVLHVLRCAPGDGGRCSVDGAARQPVDLATVA